jgi:hypothetical protein
MHVRDTRAGHVPVCEACGYRGKPRERRDVAAAALRQHACTSLHRANVRFGYLRRRPGR